MKPISLSDLEAHLVSQHNVSPELISQLADRVPESREQVASTSHALMHMTGLSETTEPHTHPEFEMPEDFEATMGLRAITDEELAENKRRYVEAFGQEQWDAAMDALAAAPDREVPLQRDRDPEKRYLQAVKGLINPEDDE